MGKEGQHKIKVDQEVLRGFFMHPDEPVTDIHLRELRKVFNIVMIKWFSSYSHYADDLWEFALIAVLERRNQYDPSFSAYNYVFTIFRNEFTNKVRKLNRETLVEDLNTLKRMSSNSFKATLPDEVERYRSYLTGEKEFTFVRIPQKDVLNIVLFLKLHESKRAVRIPEFILENENSVKVLYKMLKDTVGL